MKTLFDAIAARLSDVKAYDLPRACEIVGLPGGTDEDAFKSKYKYVSARLQGRNEAELQQIAERVEQLVPSFELSEALRLSRQGAPKLTEITRRAVVDALASTSIGGKVEAAELLSRVWPLSSLPSSDSRQPTAFDDILKHYTVEEDWSNEGLLLGRLNLLHVSDWLFCRFLEIIVHPVARDASEQAALVETLRALIAVDGFRFEVGEEVSGRLTYIVVSERSGVAGRPKNLIFASTGPKPEIVLRDAVNNDIEIVKNAEYCLVYDRPVGESGVTFEDLIAWWRDSGIEDEPTARSLYKRLGKSIASDAERALFKHYYRAVASRFGSKLPALIPQVYLHFDPLTARQRGTISSLPRQRMDFLVLFSRSDRIVIEVDGKQHYSDDLGAPSPAKYSQMVAADRELRLAGYEVFRFGGYELLESDPTEMLDEFWHRLFSRRVALG